jgi:phospholipid transport system substrate-binding protein
MTRRHLLALASALLCSLLPLVPAHAGTPTEQLKGDIALVFRTLAELPGKAEAAARRQAIQNVSRDLFDLTEMARRALGRTWDERSAAERDEFVRLLAVRVDGQIASLEPYGGAAVRYVDETIDGDRAVVRTQVTAARARDLALDYRLVRRGDRWLVWDVVVDNASLVGQYRAQFAKVIRTASYAKLVEKLAAP